LLAGYWFTGSDFRYADLSKMNDNEDDQILALKGTYFNDETKLPFSKDIAINKIGMIFKP